MGDYSAFHHGQLQVAWSMPLGDLGSIGPAVTFSTPLSDTAEDKAGLDDEVMVGVNLGVAF